MIGHIFRVHQSNADSTAWERISAMVITRCLIIKSITYGVWGPSSLHLFYLLLFKINFRCVNKDDRVDQKYVLLRFVTQTNGKIGATKDLEKSRKILNIPNSKKKLNPFVSLQRACSVVCLRWDWVCTLYGVGEVRIWNDRLKNSKVANLCGARTLCLCKRQLAFW